jgi:hypothetical protein
VVPGVIILVSACGGAASGTEGVVPAARVPDPLPIGSAYVLEADGGPPTDTTVRFTAGSSRVIVIRHPAPDYAMFAEVAFDSASFTPGGAEVEVTIRPRPGVYGIDVESSGGLRQATVTFRYAVHFLAPAGARALYGSDIAFERSLFVASLRGDTVAFLPSTRPATDNLAATLPGPGAYIVSAPREPPPDEPAR